MKYSKEDIDILLFDYLEGNLPDDEIKLVESQIAADPLILEELNTWKRSYLKPDHHPTPTGALETQLLRNPGSFSFTLFLNSVLLVCLTLIPSTNPQINPSATPTFNLQTVTSLEAIKPNSHISYQRMVMHPQQIKPPKDKALRQEIAIKEAVVITPVLTPTPEIANLSIGQVEYTIKHPASIEIATPMNAPLITQKEYRKEERALRRLKRKSLRDKTASEFMKGDIPYVVPIDTQNF